MFNATQMKKLEDALHRLGQAAPAVVATSFVNMLESSAGDERRYIGDVVEGLSACLGIPPSAEDPETLVDAVTKCVELPSWSVRLAIVVADPQTIELPQGSQFQFVHTRMPKDMEGTVVGDVAVVVKSVFLSHSYQHSEVQTRRLRRDVEPAVRVSVNADPPRLAAGQGIIAEDASVRSASISESPEVQEERVPSVAELEFYAARRRLMKLMIRDGDLPQTCPRSFSPFVPVLLFILVGVRAVDPADTRRGFGVLRAALLRDKSIPAVLSAMDPQDVRVGIRKALSHLRGVHAPKGLSCEALVSLSVWLISLARVMNSL